MKLTPILIATFMALVAFLGLPLVLSIPLVVAGFAYFFKRYQPFDIAPLMTLLVFALPAIVFGQEAATPASVPAQAAQPGIMAWITAHFADLMGVITSVVLTARVIVKLTPTPKDDTVVASIINFLKHVGLHIQD